MKQYKSGNEFLPYHASASHTPPDFRDGWNACFAEAEIRITSLKDDLQFVERWAVHHGTKSHMTAENALSLIQHYPPISAITKSYADGKIPDTFNPFTRITELEALCLNALYHHQGASSAVGQPIRKALGMGEYDRITEAQLKIIHNVRAPYAAIAEGKA